MKFSLPEVPNQVFETADAATASTIRDFEIYHDDNFGFFFNNNFDEVIYDPDTYQNEQGYSPTFLSHLQKCAGKIVSRFGVHSRVVEVGCGKGQFFKILADLGFSKLRGFDNTYQGEDKRIEKRYLSQNDAPLNADVLILRHVLEHVQNPVKFLNELSSINGSHCHFVIEVPSTDGRGAWQDPTHVSYWNENSFLYYTDAYLANFIDNTTIRFQEYRKLTHFPNEWMKNLNVCVTSAWLVAIKDGMNRLPGLLKI
jgi:SAM-dependent methyltransferase